MASARYVLLGRRIRKLQRHFMPKVFSPTGSYTEREHDHARAFRLLAHAEIEAYLEDRAKELIVTALRNFKSDGKPRSVLMNLLSFYSKQLELNERKLEEIYRLTTGQLLNALDGASAAYHYALQNTHGIRQRDVLGLLLPLGFNGSDIDTVLLANLDSFGLNRGEIAHTSVKTQRLIDPQDELKTVSQILGDLLPIENKFSALLRENR